MIDNNLNLSICRAKVNCQIRKFKITKLKQQVMQIYCHIDSTDVTENDYNYLCALAGLSNYYITSTKKTLKKKEERKKERKVSTFLKL
jgi:hypothetical protein